MNNSDGVTSIIVGTNSDSVKMFTLNRKTAVIKLLPGESYAIVTDENNKSYRQEFYYGESYLSQSGRSYQVPSNARSITIYSYSGNKRTLNF
jgi:enediyne biosynthesis protein E4